MGYKQRLPFQYTQYQVPFMFDTALKNQEARLKKITDMMNHPDVTHTQKWDLAEETKSVSLSIAKLKESIAKANNQPIDATTQNTLIARRDSKFIKHISNSMDPMNMRLDTQAYKGYLTNNFHTIERNRMTVALLQGLRISKGNQATKDAMISLYKGTMGDPDTRTLFPLLGDISPHSISRRLGKYGVNINPDKLNNRFSMINKFIAGHFLSSPMTAIVNSGQNYQKITELGIRRAKEAHEYYESHKENEALVRLIENSGVTQFADYFSDSLIGEMESREEGYDKVALVMDAMFTYHKEKKKDEPKAYEKFYRVAADVLGQQKGQQYETPPMLELDDLKARRSAFRNRRMHEIMNKFANYAINKEYKPKYGKKFYSKPFNAMKATAKAYTIAYKKTFMPTMADTEKATRSRSFLAGVLAYLDLNGIEASPHELIERIASTNNAEERQRFTKEYMGALEAGRTFADRFDFTLEAHNYAEMHRTPIGRLMMRFATWGQMKFGKDFDTIRDAITSKKDKEGAWGTTKASWRAFNKAAFTSGKKLRASEPQIASLRAYYLQGMASVLFDFFISDIT